MKTSFSEVFHISYHSTLLSPSMEVAFCCQHFLETVSVVEGPQGYVGYWVLEATLLLDLTIDHHLSLLAL